MPTCLPTAHFSRRKRTWTDEDENFWVLYASKPTGVKAGLYLLKENSLTFDLDPRFEFLEEEEVPEVPVELAVEQPPPAAPAAKPAAVRSAPLAPICANTC